MSVLCISSVLKSIKFGLTGSKGLYLELRPFPIFGPVVGVNISYSNDSGLSLKCYTGLRAEFIPGTELAVHVDTNKDWSAEAGYINQGTEIRTVMKGQGRSITDATLELRPSYTMQIREENKPSVERDSSMQKNDGSLSRKRKRYIEYTADQLQEEKTSIKRCRPE
ncbi:hypothetical protein CHS0354_038753 [Potamilus streckersoni]|uniref:Uncharacterized protein n=1 Tax=Potamilus streckersoni TaxID=2493646 RepID=A0AAE0SRM4_9BIVA|nr:hypothetical protein CHS0354_038753 [Potamilus streckersoni]